MKQTRGREKKKHIREKAETSNKMLHQNTSISVIRLNVKGLNKPIRRQWY